ncbi:DUF3365 domain-containing protein [Sulfurovum sp. XGS-02]|uniref:Tll0287-like domain-containing protein n=1 Tax=Sulfurovum sp. XGS-02 TaxID=2925411 RepID=UPI00204A4FEE|nr:DUF3365 domain-containing protein [Sulfurovum sp. XGS-02]UPT78541.1 DUF3365 domain-containing protein [Sulfurovum sp. XGS-02]
MKLQLVMASLLCTASIYASPTHLNETQEGIKYIKMLGGSLKSQLKAQLQADPSGFSAIGFCTAKAQLITNEVNAQLPDHAKVRRTSLRTRNSINKPDIKDIEVMKEIEDSIKNKTATATMIRKVNTKETTRYYKPLIVEAACLKCHGENISPEIQALIQESYPDENASHYTLGAFRGVIVSEIKKR